MARTEEFCLSVSEFAAAMEKVGRVARTIGWKFDLLALMHAAGTGAGAQARMHVRGAMDPAYANPEVRDAYAQVVATYSPTLAAEFLRGWVEHHPAPVGHQPINAWHRLIGGTRIEVSAEVPA